MELEKNIVYEDKEILVVYKEAGLAVQSAGRGIMDLEHILLNYLAKNMTATGREIPYLAVVHRLDQPVEGLLVFAKTKKAAADLSRQVQNGKMRKQYLAVVAGVPTVNSATLTDYLVKDLKSNSSRVVDPDYPGAKKAVLDYSVKNRKQAESLVEITLHSGRHHQIRVQMANAGMPLKNDRKYNAGSREAGGMVALAAYKLSFIHPLTKKNMEFQRNPQGESFKNLVE